MNAPFDTTSRDLVAALLGKRRHPQDVRIVITAFGGAMSPRYTVLVTPAGQECGSYFECGERALEMLREGRASPEELELEIVRGEP